MRDKFHEDLDEVVAKLLEMNQVVGNAIDMATKAMLSGDRGLAETVISGDQAVDGLYRDIEAMVIDLQVRQQPVASDLRLLIATQRIVADLERAGDLAKNIAKLTRRRYPNQVVPDHLRDTITEMGQIARDILDKAGRVVADQDPVLARELETDDDRMDELHRSLLRQVIGSTGSDDNVETTVDLTLCGRYYERFADHAVSIARQVIYLATGEYA
jgi:phosphate transport system protein